MSADATRCSRTRTCNSRSNARIWDSLGDLEDLRAFAAIAERQARGEA